MQIETKTVVSMSEANQNFSRVARIVDQYGQAVIFKNNSPKYLIISFSAAEQYPYVSDQRVSYAAEKIMDQYDEAFKELAK